MLLGPDFSPRWQTDLITNPFVIRQSRLYSFLGFLQAEYAHVAYFWLFRAKTVIGTPRAFGWVTNSQSQSR
jgi:hypothetical protein